MKLASKIKATTTTSVKIAQASAKQSAAPMGMLPDGGGDPNERLWLS